MKSFSCTYCKCENEITDGTIVFQCQCNAIHFIGEKLTVCISSDEYFDNKKLTPELILKAIGDYQNNV